LTIFSKYCIISIDDINTQNYKNGSGFDMKKIRIGLVGTSQLSFPGDKAEAFSNSVKDLELLSKEMDFDLLLHKDTVITEDDARIAVKYFEEQKIDFLLIQNTSFSAGNLSLVFGKIKNAYLGLWAINEGVQDGIVPFNSFCSINMHLSILHHYLKDYHLKVKWFFGSAHDEQFKKRLLITVRALRAIVNLKQSRIALIGGIAPGFNDLYNDERQFLKLFDGMVYNRLHEYDELKDIAMSVSDSEAEKIVEKMVNCSCGVHPKAKEGLLTSAKFYIAYQKFIEKNAYDAIAVSCWPKFQTDFRYSVCSVVAQLNDDGTPIACEGDILSAVSMLALKYIADDATMLMDLSNVDESDDSVLMWHCGPASTRFGKKYSLGVNYHGLPHIIGEDPNCCGVVRDMVFDEMPATVFRLTGECDQYMLMEGQFIGESKKSFFGSRGWMDSLKLNGKSIGVKDLVNTIFVTGYQHHYPIVAGSFYDELKEFSAWLNLKPIEKIEYADHLQTID
jgi:L-fucose isomerase-like protein